MVRSNEEKCRRSPCGCDAVQDVGEYSGKPGYAITFAVMRPGVVTAMTKVVEYYIPEQFRKQSRGWIVPEQRAKIIPFPTPQRKSAEHEAIEQRRS